MRARRAIRALLAALLLGLVVPVPAATQTPGEVYSSPWVRSLVEGAAARYRAQEGVTASFTAPFESEIGVLVTRAAGEQLVTGVEQVAGRATWSADGRLVQSVTGYRSRFAGPALSMLSYIRGPWVMAPLVGDRVPLALVSDQASGGRTEGGDTAVTGAWEGTDASGRRRRLPSMVNPLGSDREAFYRFSGGDTVVTLTLPTRTIPVVRITVEPSTTSADFGLLRGEIHLDAVELGVVRVRGEVLSRARPRGVLTRVVRTALAPHLFLDLEYALGERDAWLPHRQWLEMEARSPLTDEVAVVRITTDFSAAVATARAPDCASAQYADTLRSRHTLLRLEADQAGATGGWRAELGALTAERDPAELADVRRRSELRGVRFGMRAFSQAVRYDRVEGLFTGGGLRLGSPAAGNGAYAAVHGGWAWAEETARGGVEAGVAGRGWDLGLGAARSLASTNDFSRPFVTGPTIFGVLGGDDLDFVDRWSARLRGHVGLGGAATARAEVEAVRDRAVARNVERSPMGGAFRPVRAVAEGDYARLAVALDFGRGRGGEYLAPGWSGGISGELARGDLEWGRVEGFLRARRQRGRWSGAWEAYAGWVDAGDPPPQALFELGGWTSRLPGFPVKAFTGDRAAVGLVEAACVLPLLEAPVRIRSIFLPPAAPSPLAQLSAGWTGASKDAARVLGAHGWHTSEGVRATLFLGVRLFSGLARIGAARTLEEGGRWRFELGLGG